MTGFTALDAVALAVGIALTAAGVLIAGAVFAARDRRATLEALEAQGLEARDFEEYEPTYNRKQWIAGTVVAVILAGTALGGFLSALEAVTR